MLAWMLSVALAAPPADVLPNITRPENQYLDADMLPLGFSPDGMFAALYLPPDEAIGCYLWELRLTNLVTDEVTVPLHWEHDACDQQSDLAAVWKHNQAAIGAQLRAHGIQKKGDLSLRPLPSPDAGVYAWVRPGQPSVSADEQKVAVPIEVWLRAPRGEKQLGARTLSVEYGLPFSWNHEVIGYIQSPHEDRIAVVVREEHRGWEGPPNIEVVTVMGASLSSGF